ncbi:Zn-dependent hydrolase [Fodinisporobacter ferrooxydans]|uniref:Zn-dependent hydrolase n=1 Tax=Fodinisporobacter ferrooxydans TaxID=2901836 RepID=A0ABY4CLC7_9BACL|nr:Zn-dependent hydrolase [Alicyclobacillaceae bacterium MYW30-H2]
MIDQERLWQRIHQLAEIGKLESGGITRLSFSREERKAKDLVGSFMQEVGLHVYEDAVGNLIGRKQGKIPDAPVLLIGSHIDSVYNGGNFDGPLGVLGGIEVLQTMRDREIVTDHPIEVIAFTDEEGARFSFGMIGSRGLAGTLRQEHLQAQDKQGATIAEAMRENGFDPGAIGQAARSKDSVKAYVELHIEQGKILENTGLSVGVVSGIAGPLWLKFKLAGEAGHAGTTPMNLRRDALAAAAQLFQAIETEAGRTGSTVGTVGQLQLFPGGINIIPGEVEFTLDLRDVNESVRNQVEQAIREQAEAICNERGIGLQIAELQRVPPVHCSDMVQSAIRDACATLGLATTTLSSGAGHDGMQLKDLCPVGMIFARSKDGISHNPAEWTSKEDCAAGVDVLYHTVLHLAKYDG